MMLIAQNRTTVRKHVIIHLGLYESENHTEIEKETGRHYKKGKMAKMQVCNEYDGKPEQYLVCRPIKSPLYVDGRSTRGYWAVKITGTKAEMAFIKDTWRNDVKGLEPEGMIYHELLRKVTNIPKLIGYGDVPINMASKLQILAETVSVRDGSLRKISLLIIILV